MASLKFRVARTRQKMYRRERAIKIPLMMALAHRVGFFTVCTMVKTIASKAIKIPVKMCR